MKTDLSRYNKGDYSPGAGIVKRAIWFVTNLLFFKNGMHFPSFFKRSILRLFGAKIGKAVVIKPSVNIKYPWNLEIGNFCWIGEKVWIDNLDTVIIGNHVCISQEALLLTGNHSYKKSSFDLITGRIILEDGAWIGAKTIVTGDVTVGSHAVLSAGSCCSKDLDPYYIYRGNPAKKVRERIIEE